MSLWALVLPGQLSANEPVSTLPPDTPGYSQIHKETLMGYTLKNLS